MIRLFATDLDGTILNQYHDLDHVIEQRVDRLLEEGRDFAVVTGRDQFSLPKGFMERDVYIICLNGAMIMDPNNEIIHVQPMDKEIVRGILEAVPGAPFDCMTRDKKLTPLTREQFQERLMRSDFWKRLVAEDLMEIFTKGYQFEATKEDILKEEIVKMNCRDMSADQRRTLDAYLDKHADQVINAPSYPEFIELTHVDANKGEAVKKLADSLGIPYEEVAVYGDGWNDASMLTAFSHSYVPNSAPEDIQALATEVIGPYEEYSVSGHMVSLLQK